MRLISRHRTSSELILLLCLVLLVVSLLLPYEFANAAPYKRKSYTLRKGSRLDRHHRRSIHEWRKAHRHTEHRHRKHYKIHRFNLDEILRQMDSVVKPRFGR